MKQLVWVILGCLGLSVMTALAARLGVYHLVPDFAVVVTVFLALRREPVPMTLAVVPLGYFSGCCALAPLGLHEMGLLFVAFWVYRGAGSFGGSGSIFFGFLCGGMLCIYHVFLYCMLYLIRGEVGFSSWATGLFIPAASVTAIVAIVAYHPMVWLDSWVAPKRQVGLSWR